MITFTKICCDQMAHPADDEKNGANVTLSDQMVAELKTSIEESFQKIQDVNFKLAPEQEKILATFDIGGDEELHLKVLAKRLATVGGWKIFVAKVGKQESLSIAVVTNFGINGTFIQAADKYLEDEFWLSQIGNRFKQVMVDEANKRLKKWSKGDLIQLVDNSRREVENNQILSKISWSSMDILSCCFDPITEQYVKVLNAEYYSDIPIFSAFLCMVFDSKPNENETGRFSIALTSDYWVNMLVLGENFPQFIVSKEGSALYSSHYEDWADDDKGNYKIMDKREYYVDISDKSTKF